MRSAGWGENWRRGEELGGYSSGMIDRTAAVRGAEGARTWSSFSSSGDNSLILFLRFSTFCAKPPMLLVLPRFSIIQSLLCPPSSLRVSGGLSNVSVIERSWFACVYRVCFACRWSFARVAPAYGARAGVVASRSQSFRFHLDSIPPKKRKWRLTKNFALQHMQTHIRSFLAN